MRCPALQVCFYIECEKQTQKSSVNTSHQGGDNGVKISLFCTNFAFQTRAVILGCHVLCMSYSVIHTTHSAQLSRRLVARQRDQNGEINSRNLTLCRKTMYRHRNWTKLMSQQQDMLIPQILFIRIRKAQDEVLKITAEKKIFHIVRFIFRIK